MYHWMSLFAITCLFLSGTIATILANRFKRGSAEEKAEYVKIFPAYFTAVFLLLWAGLVVQLLCSALNQDYFGLLVTLLMVVLLIRYSQVYKNIMAFVAKKMPFFTVEANDLIARLLMEKNNKNLITYSSLFLSLVAEYVIYRQTSEFSVLIAIALTLALLVLSFANQQILYYRWKHGLYGTCYSEAKEIVTFILEWHRESGNSNGKPPKLVFTQEELDECLQVNGGEEYAG